MSSMVETWHPCRKGFVPADECPKCTPPLEDRCPEFREVVQGYPGNSPDVWIARYPCRILGDHEVHRDGMGTSWWIEDEKGYKSDGT